MVEGGDGDGNDMSDSEEDRVEKQLKIAFVGEANVGKTSIIRRFCYDEFSRQYTQTIGADFYIRRLLLPGGREITIKITDVGGLELHRHMLSNYIFNTSIILLVYDITSSASFDCLSMWIDNIRKRSNSNPTYVVLGNKCDLEHQRAVRLDKTQHFVRDYGVQGFLVSGKTGEAVNTTLIDLIARHFGICLTGIQKEHEELIVRPELIAESAERIRAPVPPPTNSSICSLQ